MRTIVLTGGGTAGHVLPNIALLPGLRSTFDHIYYLGGHGVEQALAQQNGLTYYAITTVKLRRTLTLKNLLIPFKLWRGIREAKKILRQLHPDVVFSKGGFVALPVVYAAHLLGIKVIAHESDMTMGLANRLTAKYCHLIGTTFPLVSQLPQVVQTGAIIRNAIYHGDAAKIKLPANRKPKVLIMGGSLGATAINQIVWQNLAALCQRFNIVHLTGKGKSNQQYQHAHYCQLEYLAQPEDAFAWADVVVARSGSGTVSELLALRKPAIYIPLPKNESRGDQIQNATYMSKLGVGVVLEQATLTLDSLIATIQDVYARRATIKEQCAQQTWIDGTQTMLNYLRQN